MTTSFASSLVDPNLFIEKSYIAGQWVPSKSGKVFEIRNPASDELIGTCPESNNDDLDDAIKAASGALPAWRSLSGRQRGRILRRLFDLLVENKEDLGKIILAENGKSKGDAEGEVLFSAGFFEWFGEEAARIYGDIIPHSNSTSRSHVIKEPIGVCALITPWNFPMAMGARKVAAALAAGCTVILKSDGLTPFSSNALAMLGERAGVPAGVLNVVTAKTNTPQLGLSLCESDVVKKISFTGSTRVGKLLMQQSSGTLKKLSLELGGNAPFIVFDDADVEVASRCDLASAHCHGEVPWSNQCANTDRLLDHIRSAGRIAVSDGLTPFSSNALAMLGERAGVPAGVLNVVTARTNTPQLGLSLCESDVVKKISFTGSTRVGKLLMQQSSGTLKKLSLELGGNAPFIVFDDADVEVAVTSALISKFKVTGQTCVAANRIFVQEGIYDKFSQRLVEEVRKFRVGNGADSSVTHGPLTNGVEKVEEHIKDAISKNAKVLLGGKRLPLGKNFHELTILGDVNDTMLVIDEEIFGPIAALTKFKTEDEVIARANNSNLGLASYLMTTDLARSARVSERLEFGMVAINTGVISDAAAPFGGVKHSGMGREGSKYGVDEYISIKTIVTGGINTWSRL